MRSASLRCLRADSWVSPGSAETIQNVTRRERNWRSSRCNSGAYRLAIGQSVQTKIRTEIRLANNIWIPNKRKGASDDVPPLVTANVPDAERAVVWDKIERKAVRR